MDLLGLRHKFFNPLWRRVATVAFCILWGLFEAYNGNWIWSGLFVALGLFCGWVFFIGWQDLPDED